MDLLYYLKFLYRKKWIIISLSCLAMLSTYLILINKTPLFTSVAQYSTGYTSEKVRLTDGTSSLDFYNIELKFDNAIETIKSAEVLSRISYILLLHDLTNPQNAYTKLSKKAQLDTVYKNVNKDSAITILTSKLAKNELLRSNVLQEKNILEFLKLYKYDNLDMVENLSVYRVGITDYLDISYTSGNPELSAVVVNSIGVVFLNYYKGLNQTRMDENAHNIKDLLYSQQAKVDSLGQLLLSEKVSQGTIDPVSRTTNAMATVADLESRLADEKSKYNEHFYRYNSLTSRLAELQSATPTNTANQDVIRLTNKRNDLVEELNRKGGKDAALEKQISDLRTEINNKSNLGSGNSKLKDDIDDITMKIREEQSLLSASKSTIDEYEASIKRYSELTNANPGTAVKTEAIQTQLNMENKQLSNLKEIANQIAGLAKDDPTSNFIQTITGQAPIEPNSKKTLVNIALAGVSVFFLSTVLFILLEIFDSSVKTPSIFYKLTKSKNVSIINKVKLKRESASSIIQQEFLGKKFWNYNIFKNNIRKLRFDLINADKKIFLFTSTQRNTGKTTIIEALATSLTLSKKKVLVVDMNFSNNSLTRVFNTEVYIQDIIQANNFSQQIKKDELAGSTPINNLFIIGCKEGNTTPSETFLKEELATFFAFVKKNYDFILVEGASLNNFSDSKELTRFVDGVFTVFSADSSFLQADKISMKFITDLQEKNWKSIADMQEKNCGVILNKVLPANINS
jgi:polysaccharide biosynthesis transport protein